MGIAFQPIPPIPSDVEARIWSSIEKRLDGIWAWLRYKKGKPARIHIGYIPYYINRVMWVMSERRTNPDYQIPDGMFVCHRNDVSPDLYDCNPANLWLGTAFDNAIDRERKGRGNHPTGDKNGKRTRPDLIKWGDESHARLHPERMARGEKNGNAKLKWPQIHEIRALYATGEYRQKELAARFGVTWYSIKGIVLRKSWRSDYANAYADNTSQPALGETVVPAPGLA